MSVDRGVGKHGFVTHNLPHDTIVGLIKSGLIISAVAIVVRLLWIFPAAWGARVPRAKFGDDLCRCGAG